ncbi:uncharacterized protein METZ01_LOCUS168127, partial [marine metagenome]
RTLQLKEGGKGQANVSTELNCEPRDMVELGQNRFLFGFNVHLGLKQGELGDVFAAFDYDEAEGKFFEADIAFLRNKDFVETFTLMFKKSPQTTFHKFSVVGPHLYMVFREGKLLDDLVVYKWVLADGGLTYVDGRAKTEYLDKAFPKQFDFQWRRPARSATRHGLNPHISIEDRVFVECVGGDLTIKVEDTTDTGEGIYAEEVTDRNQKVEDAEIYYAIQGSMILLKIIPFREDKARYFIFNEKLQAVNKVDSMGQACVMLPGDQGLVFPDGYYLQTEEKPEIFASDSGEMVLERIVNSPNGEDYLYVFFDRQNGIYMLMPYRMIDQKVTGHFLCSGFTLFPNGDLLSFRASDEATKHHSIQLRQSPFYQPECAPESGNRESFLYGVGNKAAVSAMSECHEVLALIHKESPYADLYADVFKRCRAIPNNYHWLDKEEGAPVVEILKKIGDSADKAIAEFDKVRRLRFEAKQKTEEIQKRAKRLFNEVVRVDFHSVDDFVANLGGLRRLRGVIITLHDEVRYVDKEVLSALLNKVQEQVDVLSKRCVDFLLEEDSLNPYRERAEVQRGRVDEVTKVSEAKELEAEITQAGEDLEMLIDIVRSLQIDDTTEQTRIVESITAIYQIVNQVKEALKNKARTLMSAEGSAQFNAQMLLLSQTAVNYLDMSDSPEKCDEYFNNIINQLENLGGDFADFPEY